MEVEFNRNIFNKNVSLYEKCMGYETYCISQVAELVIKTFSVCSVL
jgi:hypothetical protein